MRRARGLLLAVVAITALASCSSGNGSAGPLGPQPQAKASGFEVWRTPYPTPFGTTGLPDIPPRPTFAARLAHPTFDPRTPAPVIGPTWETPAIADAALAPYRPVLPADAITTVRYQVSRPYSLSCASVSRDVAVADVEAFYVEARRAVLAAGFVTTSEIGRQHDGEFAVVLRAYTLGVSAQISTGTSAAAGALHPYLVRVEFTQRCV